MLMKCARLAACNHRDTISLDSRKQSYEVSLESTFQLEQLFGKVLAESEMCFSHAA